MGLVLTHFRCSAHVDVVYGSDGLDNVPPPYKVVQLGLVGQSG